MVDVNNKMANNAAAAATAQQLMPKKTVPTKMSEPAKITMPGLGSGMDTQGMIRKMVAAEEKRVEPVKQRVMEVKTQVAAWNQVRQVLDALSKVAEPLMKKETWEAKKIESSNPKILEAKGTSKAKPGTYQIKVEQLALKHQIASQTFASKDEQINQGKFSIKVGDDKPFVVEINEKNNTLKGFVEAINKASDGAVKATLVNTGGDKKPWQIVLTSNKSGIVGRLLITSSLKGQFKTPNFEAGYKSEQRWNGVTNKKDDVKDGDKKDSSTTIPKLGGVYTGSDPIDVTVTVVNPGIIGNGKDKVRLKWEDTLGRSGYLDFDPDTYNPNSPVPLTDGVSIALARGTAVAGDSFKVSMKNQESPFYWWKTDAERASKIGVPSTWKQPDLNMKPNISGWYGDDDADFKIHIEGSGIVGEAQDLHAVITSDNGVHTRVNIGKGYTPRKDLSVAKGMKINFPRGILNDKAELTFQYQGSSTESYWWLTDDDKKKARSIYNLGDWVNNDLKAKVAKEKKTNVPVRIVGRYNAFNTRHYTFTAEKEGTVGESRELVIDWKDDKGHKGTIDLGQRYKAGSPVEFSEGLQAEFGPGFIEKGDSFDFKVYSTTIQPPQDARIKLGATDTGGGLDVTSHTNEFKDTIEGVTLTAKSVSDEIVTVTVKNDIEDLRKKIKAFIDYYNETLKFLKELSYYDKDKKTAGPLQGNSNIMYLQNQLSRIITDSVVGLKTKKNQLFSVGVKFVKDGSLSVDEKKLDKALDENLKEVALLFETNGALKNGDISYVGSTNKTGITGKQGYDIDVTQAPEYAEYQTPQLGNVFYINEGGNKFSINLNSRNSKAFEIPAGQYTMDSLINKLQSLFKKNDILNKAGIKFLQRNGSLILQVNSAGEHSKISLQKENPGADPLSGGIEKAGRNAEGSIDGQTVDSFGAILKGKEGTKLEGLRLYVNPQATYDKPVDNNLVLTKGIATKTFEYLSESLDTKHGELKLYTDTAKTEEKGYEDQAKKMEAVIERKKERWQQKFARMEGKLGQLKSEQKYLSSQFAKLK